MTLHPRSLHACHRLAAFTIAGLSLINASCSPTWPVDVEAALAKAGGNRAELQRVLTHYRQHGNAEKLEAARFLIANMDGHGYTVTALYDAEGNEIPFDALDHADYNEARHAMEALEAEHGELEFKRKRFDDDLQTVTAAYLIENIDLAFEARRGKPWARTLSFEAFCRFVLPYRGSNEPLNSWRQACMERYADLEQRLTTPDRAHEAARLIRQDVHEWIRFNELYYLHPTDQGFDEICARRRGRCEDISNMMAYAMRANAIPTATDYTPYWADRDNNHAWEVVLDDHGRGHAALTNRAAKIYRKTFALQRENLAFRENDNEKVPRWLAGKSYIDVTAQYTDTSDVAVQLEHAPPESARFAYIAVFNGGEWKAIHWGEIQDGAVTFGAMGRNIAYLPAYYVEERLVPAGPPFIITKRGEIRTLRPDAAVPLTVAVAATAPTTPDADSGTNRPTIVVKPGNTYELFVWDDGWTSLGKLLAADEPVLFDAVPSAGLYWLVEEGSRRLERIFTIESGKQVWW